MKALELQLALRNVFRQGLRSLMPLVVVAIASFVIVFIGGLYEFMFRNLELSTIRSDGHISVTAAPDQAKFMTDERLARVRAIKGVALVAPRATVSGMIGIGDRGSVFSGRMVDPVLEQAMRDYPNQSTNNATKTISGDPQASIGVLLAKGLNGKPGDWLSGLAANRGFSATIGELVQTEAEEKDRFFLELPFAALGDQTLGMVDSLHVQIKAGADLNQVMQAIRTIFAADGQAQPTVLTYLDPSAYVNSVKTIYQNNLLFIMIVLALTVFLAVATSFTMAITERSAELGTIRSFGGGEWHIFSLFQLESLFVALVGFAIGLSITIITALIVNGLGGIVIPPPPTASRPIRLGFVFQANYALLALLIVVVVGQASAFVVTRRIGHLSIIKQLGLNS